MDPLLKAIDIFEPSGENVTLIIIDSSIWILITECLILFNKFTSINLFDSRFPYTGPAVKLLAIPMCHISTFKNNKYIAI